MFSKKDWLQNLSITEEITAIVADLIFKTFCNLPNLAQVYNLIIYGKLNFASKDKENTD